MSEAVVSGTLAPDVSSDIRAAHSHLARRFLKNPLGIAALSVLTLIVLAAIFLGEGLGAIQALGGAAVLAGAVIISLTPVRRPAEVAAERP